MLRAFWTWLPFASGTYRAFDEPFAYAHNRWFFDKSIWQRMFRTMNSCGFNAVVFANTHPFPFMVDLPAYPDARVISEEDLRGYQQMCHWIFETAIEYDMAPFLLFFSIYFPVPMLESRGIDPAEASKPTDLAFEYTHYCVRELLATYPELAGVFADASEAVYQPTDLPGYSSRTRFLQQAVVDSVDAVRPDAALYLRGWCGSAKDFVSGIKRRAGRPLVFSVKYTYEHLVDPNPDPVFREWVEFAGAPNVAAELWISNFEPWTSFSYDTAEGILDNLKDLGCVGFSIHPLSLYEWPRTSDTGFRYQFQRDLVWYSVWGGAGFDRLLNQGQPKWLLRNQKLIHGFQAASRIMELLALYFAGDKQNQWHPQFCSIRDYDGAPPHLFSIEDMLHLDDQPVFNGRDWWHEITGDKVVHLAEYVESGTPGDAYGPEELIEELTDLAEQAVSAGETGMRSASGEKELPSFARDAFCMGRLGEFYVERLRAALAHARGEDAEALEHMSRALGLYRDIRSVDRFHRAPFRVITGRCALICDWIDVIHALESEYEDASKGEFKLGINYPIGALEGVP
ncbi:MAG: hypothetical protein N3B12_06640 [Armatimonadetes bacterium]|nr:hypothetical protein [Armatimonadota bacterium]